MHKRLCESDENNDADNDNIYEQCPLCPKMPKQLRRHLAEVLYFFIVVVDNFASKISL